MKSDWIESTEFSITEEATRKSTTNVLPAGTVVVASRVGLGKVCRVRQATAINQDLRGFLPKNREQLDEQYLFHWFKSIAHRIIKAGTGATVQGVTLPFLQSLEIPLPPLADQRRIAAALDDAFAAIATAATNTQASLANARSLFPSILAEALRELEQECEIRELRNLLIDGRKISYGIVKPGPHDPEGVRLVKSQQVRDDSVDLNPDFRITRALDEEYARTRLQGGEILLNLVGASIGRSAIAPNELRGANVSRAIAVIPVEPELAAWVQYNLRGSVGQKLIRLKTGGSAQPVLNLSEVKTLPIPVPPAARRDIAVQRLDIVSAETRRLVELYCRKIAALTELQQSLLHRTFFGDLTVDETAVPASANDNFATPEFAAQVLAFAHSRHVALGRAPNFGRVKAQKTLHVVEAIGGLDLGRQPMKDAAGPNDFAHMRQVEDWARQHSFFEFVQRTNGGYDFRQLQNYGNLLDESKRRLQQAGESARRAVELLVDMDSDWAEIVVTTHAAWNNLILDQATITDDAIVHAARDDWHPDKLRYDKSRFHDALRFIRSKGIEPCGSAKRVGGQEKLPL